MVMLMWFQKLIAEDSTKYAAEQKIAERCN
jgi:hypothetical protein